MRAALTNLGADVRADFYYTLTAWQNNWLLPALPGDWLATDHLVAEVESMQAPLDGLLDLQRFLTAGFLPSANTPHAESIPAAAADRTTSVPFAASAAPTVRTATAAVPAAPGRATSAAPAGEQAAYLLPSPDSRTRSRTGGAAAPVNMHPPTTSPSVAPSQRPPTPGRAWATPPSASMLPPDSSRQSTPVPDTMHGSGLRTPAHQKSSSGAPLQVQAGDSREAGELFSWPASPTRIGGLRDLAQRLPAHTLPPAPWADPPESPASRLWPAHEPDRPASHVEEPQIAASTSPATSSLTRASSVLGAASTEDPAATLPPVTAPASTTPTASVLHGQSEPIPAPASVAAIPPIHTTLSQVDTLMDALVREITREYHRFYGA